MELWNETQHEKPAEPGRARVGIACAMSLAATPLQACHGAGNREVYRILDAVSTLFAITYVVAGGVTLVLVVLLTVAVARFVRRWVGAPKPDE